MYHQILAPLDGSRFAETALPLALSLSRRTGAALHFVMVQEPIPSFAYDEWEGAAQRWSEEYLSNLVERVREYAGGNVTTALRSGQVIETLQEEAEAKEADLVVMATHGRGALSRMWLGSVADAFIRHTDRPILLVRPESDDPEAPANPTAGFHVEKVLIPLDGSGLAESILPYAVEFGMLFDAAYHLVRVVPFPMEVASPYLPDTIQMNQEVLDQGKRLAEAYLEEQAGRLRKSNLSVSFGVRVDVQPGHGILQESEEAGCDFIAMATHGRGGLSRAILGSATDKVIRGTKVPLLLSHPRE